MRKEDFVIANKKRTNLYDIHARACTQVTSARTEPKLTMQSKWWNNQKSRCTFTSHTSLL